MGITTSLNGLGTIVHMLVIGCMTDYSGQYNAAMKYSGGLVFLAGILSAIISPISNKYRVTWGFSIVSRPLVQILKSDSKLMWLVSNFFEKLC